MIQPESFRVTRMALAALAAHAEADAPHEACGVLVGATEVATAAWRLPNEAADPSREYLMAGGLCAAQRRWRTAGLRLLAYYHSHPSGPARPSAADRMRSPSCPDLPHLIVGLAPTPEVHAWVTHAWCGARLEIALRIVIVAA